MKHGMMTLDQSLAGLVKKGLVDYESALERAQNVAEFKMQCGGGDPTASALDGQTPGFHDVSAPRPDPAHKDAPPTPRPPLPPPPTPHRTLFGIKRP